MDCSNHSLKSRSARFASRATQNLKLLSRPPAVNEILTIGGEDSATAAGWPDPTYDNAGNMTRLPKPSTAPDDVDITEEFEAIYDAWNRLVELKYDDKTYFRYEYDGLNRRIRKIEYNSAGDTPVQATSCYYSTAWQLLEEYINDDPEESGTYELAYTYVWGKPYIDSLVMRVHYILDSNDELIVDQTLYGLQDSKYNVGALYDADSNAVVERYEYTAYGECTVMDESYTPRTSNESLYEWAIRYSGYRFDIESGLYCVRNRYYHTQIGRWLQRDPLMYLDGFNSYLYVQSRPIGNLDPMGLLSLSDWIESSWGGDISIGIREKEIPIGGIFSIVFAATFSTSKSRCCHPKDSKIYGLSTASITFSGALKAGKTLVKDEKYDDLREQRKADAIKKRNEERGGSNASGTMSPVSICPKDVWYDDFGVDLKVEVFLSATLAVYFGITGEISAELFGDDPIVDTLNLTGGVVFGAAEASVTFGLRGSGTGYLLGNPTDIDCCSMITKNIKKEYEDGKPKPEPKPGKGFWEHFFSRPTGGIHACFIAGTIVWTQNNNTAIEKLKIGDYVWSYNHNANSWEKGSIINNMIFEHKGLMVEIALNGEFITSTHSHPYWVISGSNLSHRPDVELYGNETADSPTGRWVSAEHLKVGDILLSKSSGPLEISSMRIYQPDKIISVYNITIDNYKNYIVGGEGILVHNKM